MALLQCTCTFCDHLFYRVTTPCEFDNGKQPELSCPACSNILLETTNLTPEAPTACPGCSSDCGPSDGKTASGCASCSGGCGLKEALAA